MPAWAPSRPFSSTASTSPARPLLAPTNLPSELKTGARPQMEGGRPPPTVRFKSKLPSEMKLLHCRLSMSEKRRVWLHEIGCLEGEGFPPPQHRTGLTQACKKQGTEFPPGLPRVLSRPPLPRRPHAPSSRPLTCACWLCVLPTTGPMSPSPACVAGCVQGVCLCGATKKKLTSTSWASGARAGR
jgi:hypothetical protein